MLNTSRPFFEGWRIIEESAKTVRKILGFWPSEPKKPVIRGNGTNNFEDNLATGILVGEPIVFGLFLAMSQNFIPARHQLRARD